MNKTVHINVAGFAFIIEENAYQELSKYLDNLGKNISDEAERKEVLEDIEARIAEIFQECLKKEHREVIIHKDVKKVIGIMGEPEEIYEGSESYSYETKEAKPKRLYRDVENGMLGGVCSGLAAYFNTDVIWPRILFLFLFFTLGSGFLLYIVLWIIVPPATTTAQKLEMQGEPVTVDSIKKSFHKTKEQIEKEINLHKNKYNKKDVKRKTKTAAEEVISTSSLIFSKLFKVISIFIGVVLWTVAFSLLISTFAAFIGEPIIHIMGDSGYMKSFNLEDFRRIFMTSKFFDWGISSILFALTMAFFIGGFHLIFGAKRKTMVSWSVPSFFFIGIILIAFGYFNQTKEYQATGKFENRIPLPTNNDTLYISASHLPKELGEHKFKWKVSNSIFSMNEQFALADDIIYFSNAKFTIRPSVNDSFQLVVSQTASGKSEEEANTRAENIQFGIQTNGDSLTLNSFFTTGINNSVREQKIKYILEIPNEKFIYLDSSILKIAQPLFNKRNLPNNQLINTTRQFNNGILE